MSSMYFIGSSSGWTSLRRRTRMAPEDTENLNGFEPAGSAQRFSGTAARRCEPQRGRDPRDGWFTKPTSRAPSANAAGAQHGVEAAQDRGDRERRLRAAAQGGPQISLRARAGGTYLASIHRGAA